MNFLVLHRVRTEYCCLKMCISIARTQKKNENIINAGYWVLSEQRKN